MGLERAKLGPFTGTRDFAYCQYSSEVPPVCSGQQASTTWSWFQFSRNGTSAGRRSASNSASGSRRRRSPSSECRGRSHKCKCHATHLRLRELIVVQDRKSVV